MGAGRPRCGCRSTTRWRAARASARRCASSATTARRAQLFDLETADLNGFKTSFGARVRIEMEDGRSFEMEQEVPTGSGARPFDERRKAVEDKFRRETRYTLRKERMEKAIDIVHHLEDASAVAPARAGAAVLLGEG